MGLRDRLKAAGTAFFRPQANTITTSEDLDAWIRDGGATSVSGVSVTEKKAAAVAAVFTCVRVLRMAISHLPLVLYVQEGRRRVPDTRHPLYGLLHDRPNEWQTSLEWRESMQRDVELRGNAYARIVLGVGGRIIELIRLHPDTVTPKQDELMRVTYEYTRPNGQRVVLRNNEVLHIKGYSDDGLVGMNPIREHRETIGDAIAMREHGARFFSNGGKPLGAFEVNVESGTHFEMSQASKDAFRADFDEAHSGGVNAHKSMLVPQGLTYKPISISMEDSQYIDGRKFTRSEIFGLFGVPPHKGGDLERATFSNIEHQSIEFVVDAIVPRCVRWEQAIKRDLLWHEQDRFVRHNVAGLLRGDTKSRAEALQIQRRNGVINANEWRLLEDLNPRTDEGGDEYIVETAMRPDDGRDPTNPETRD